MQTPKSVVLDLESELPHQLQFKHSLPLAPVAQSLLSSHVIQRVAPLQYGAQLHYLDTLRRWNIGAVPTISVPWVYYLLLMAAAVQVQTRKPREKN